MKYTVEQIKKVKAVFSDLWSKQFGMDLNAPAIKKYFNVLDKTLDPYQAKVQSIQYINSNIMPTVRKTKNYKNVVGSSYLVSTGYLSREDAADYWFRTWIQATETLPVHATIMLLLDGNKKSFETRKKAIADLQQNAASGKLLQISGVEMNLLEKIGSYLSAVGQMAGDMTTAAGKAVKDTASVAIWGLSNLPLILIIGGIAFVAFKGKR